MSTQDRIWLIQITRVWPGIIAVVAFTPLIRVSHWFTIPVGLGLLVLFSGVWQTNQILIREMQQAEQTLQEAEPKEKPHAEKT